MNLKPIGDKIIIKKMKAEEKTLGGIILPDSAKEAPQHAEVVSIGPDILNDEKKKDQIKVGDKVVYSKFAGVEIKINDQDLIICKLPDLLAVVE